MVVTKVLVTMRKSLCSLFVIFVLFSQSLIPSAYFISKPQYKISRKSLWREPSYLQVDGWRVRRTDRQALRNT